MKPVAPEIAAPQLLGDIRQLIEQSRGQLAAAVNSALTMLYWHIGHRIRTEVLGSERAAYWLSSPPPARAVVRDELVLRILLVVATRPTEAPAVIDVQRHLLIERLQQIRKVQRAAGSDLVEQMASDAGATRVEADLVWLDRCAERLRAASAAENEEQPQ